MSDDLLRQAELRHQRRPVARKNEEILPLDVSKQKTTTLLIGDKLPTDGSCLPPIRHFGNYDKPHGGNVVSHDVAEVQGQQSDLRFLSPKDKPRTPRRRIASNNENLEVAKEDIASDHENVSTVLPFIKCKVNDKNAKALINTSSQRSTISQRLIEGAGFKDGKVSKVIQISDKEIHVNFTIHESAMHDLVLGVDFLQRNQCLLDFSTNALTLKGKNGLTTPLLTEKDLPLKLRSKPGLAASF